MRLQNTVLILFVLVFGFCEISYSQSNQYKRSRKSSKAKSKTQKKGGKVDISDLEEKYWMAKDTEFKVVQNRLYSKANRFNTTLGFGVMINDGFSVGNTAQLSVGYYFTERYGVEMQYTHYLLKDSKMTSNFESEFGATPDYNIFKSYIGASFQWVPIYAKLSLFDKKILYFDFIFSPGLGVLSYEQQTEDGGMTETSPVVNFDIAQQIYIHKNWAIRVELQNRYLTSEKVREYNNPDNVSNTSQLSTTLMIGITGYFGDGAKKGEENESQ